MSFCAVVFLPAGALCARGVFKAEPDRFRLLLLIQLHLIHPFTVRERAARVCPLPTIPRFVLRVNGIGAVLRSAAQAVRTLFFSPVRKGSAAGISGQRAQKNFRSTKSACAGAKKTLYWKGTAPSRAGIGRRGAPGHRRRRFGETNGMACGACADSSFSDGGMRYADGGERGTRRRGGRSRRSAGCWTLIFPRRRSTGSGFP